MKVVYCPKYGAPENLEIREVDKPVTGSKDVLVKVFATTVNRTDCGILRGKPFILRFFTGLFSHKNKILGTEYAGEVVEIGSDVTEFKVGDRVFGFKDDIMSTYAQFMVINQNQEIIKMPDNISYENAAPSFEGGHYAYNFISKAKLNDDSKVLVYGATGAIGSAAVQLLKARGIYVTAVGTTKNVKLVKGLGADKVVDYETSDFTTDELKYDFVFDAVGKSSFGVCRKIMKPKGVYISSELGKGGQNVFYSILTPLTRGQKVIFPLPVNCKRSMIFIADLIAEKKYKAVIDRVYEMKDIIEAYKYVESGQKTGNVVIKIEQ